MQPNFEKTAPCRHGKDSSADRCHQGHPPAPGREQQHSARLATDGEEGVRPPYQKLMGIEAATGICTVRYTPVIDDDIIYDLNGRRVNESTLRPGIYIKNRKKIVIR